MKTILSVLAVVLCAICSPFAQAPAIQWQNTIGGDSDDKLCSLQQTTDGGYILGGFSFSDISGDKSENHQGESDYWVVKLNDSGAVQWQNTIGGTSFDVLFSLQQTTEGGYILGGYSSSDISIDKTENSLGGRDFWVVKLNDTGNIQWQNTIGGSGSDILRAIQLTSDGGYILGGNSDSNISGDKTENSLGDTDYWLLKLDATGIIQWQKTIGGNLQEYLHAVQQTADGGYILGGHSDSSISGDKTENSNGESDLWIIKLAPEFVPTKETSTALKAMAIYPNPTTDALFVNCETATTLCLQNSFGQILSTQTIQGQGKIDLSRYPNGIYFLVEMETGVGHKILKNK